MRKTIHKNIKSSKQESELVFQREIERERVRERERARERERDRGVSDDIIIT